MDVAEERARFRELQAGFAKAWAGLAANPKAPRTVVVLPSLSLDAEVMTRISGVHHYADSDDVGRAFRFDVGHLFRSKSAGRSD